MPPPRRAALDKIRDFWNGQADWNAHVAIFDTEAVRDPATRDAAFAAAGEDDARMLARHVGRDARVIDLGCGMGRVMRPLAPRCREVIGVDISSEMLSRARRYLDGVENVRLVQTDGASLPGIEDGSIDLVYSLLVLIHVDRRSAYCYFREIRRVLRDQGLALLQFQNILAPEGLAAFQAVIDGDDPDYPLEFYTSAELEHLLGSVGLEVVATQPTDSRLFVTAVAGSVEAWKTVYRDALTLQLETVEGVFAGGRASFAAGGRIVARLSSTASRTLALTGFAAIAAPSGRVHVEAPLEVPPGGSCSVEIVLPPGGDALELRVDGAPAPWQGGDASGSVVPAGEAQVHLAFLPPAHYPDAETAALFPNLFEAAAVVLADG